MSHVAPLVRATLANAPFGAAVLARVPLAFATILDLQDESITQFVQ